MEIEDSVYGNQKLEKEVIQELIESDPVQRLKDINHHGPSNIFLEEKPVIKRFDHSVGVFLLLRGHNASVQEQIAGLLHDVPHTAFSHVVDFVFDTENHEYHERFMEQVIFSSDIPKILERNGFETNYILDEDNFGLLERDLPLLCADRLDYAMRDIKAQGISDVADFRQNLTTLDGEFIFRDFKVAKRFAENFIRLDSEVYASPREVAIFHLFGEALREMIEAGELTEGELFRTDTYVLEKVRNSDIERVENILQVLDEGPEIEAGAEDYDFTGETKARAVDPPFIRDGEKVRVSEVSEKVEEKIQSHLDNVNSGFKIKVRNFEAGD